jgi:hypothetical protein
MNCTNTIVFAKKTRPSHVYGFGSQPQECEKALTGVTSCKNQSELLPVASYAAVDNSPVNT